MQLAFQAVAYLQDTPGLDWSTAGPAAALIRSCKYVGWRVLEAHRLQSHNGSFIDLEVGSPCMLRHIYRARLHEVLVQEAFLRDLDEMGKRFGCGAAALDIKNQGLDILQAKQMVNSKRQGLNSWQKQQLIALMCNSRLGQKDQCKQCNLKGGIAHRVWECPAQTNCSP